MRNRLGSEWTFWNVTYIYICIWICMLYITMPAYLYLYKHLYMSTDDHATRERATIGWCILCSKICYMPCRSLRCFSVHALAVELALRQHRIRHHHNLRHCRHHCQMLMFDKVETILRKKTHTQKRMRYWRTDVFYTNNSKWLIVLTLFLVFCSCEWDFTTSSLCENLCKNA